MVGVNSNSNFQPSLRNKLCFTKIFVPITMRWLCLRLYSILDDMVKFLVLFEENDINVLLMLF